MKYKIKKSSRVRKMRISIGRGGGVLVIIPHTLSEQVALEFVKEKEDWIQKKRQQIKKRVVDKDIESQSQSHFLEYKDAAYEVIEQEIDMIVQEHDFSFGTIRIKRLKTRWGSCSSKGNLNFNYKLLFMSPQIREYVVVHELCHLRHMNHSRKFWKEVEIILPNYKVLRKQLRDL